MLCDLNHVIDSGVGCGSGGGGSDGTVHDLISGS
jgi:hypothetical protein